MTRATLRGLWGRRLRAGLTALAVLIGVALMAGSYVLTDTINASFDDIFEETSKGVDVAVVPKEQVERQDGEPPGFSASLLERVRGVDGVAVAEGSIFDTVSILGHDGEPIATQGSPNFAASEQREPFDPFNYVEGRAPRTDREVAVDSFTADREGFGLNETVRVVGDRGAQAYRITGIAKLGEVASFGGASVAVLTLPEAQEAVGKEGKLDEISIAAAAGTTQQALKRRIAAVMPATVTVRTGQENADAQSQDTADDLSFLKTALLVFAFIALFVGAFTIFNTFSITVAQRSREFGVLRTIGASRRQILISVVLEALLIGVIGSLLGILAGLAVAAGIGELFAAVGIDLPNTGTVVATRTIVVSLVVGSLVTLLAALAPAVRATRVSPMEALHEAAAPPRRRRPIVLPLALALAALGVRSARLRALRRDRGQRRRRRTDRARRRDHLPRRGSAEPAAGTPARLAGRTAARAAAGTHRAARARELHAQPRSHRRHGGGADDRTRPGHLRHRVRRGPEGLVRRRDRPGPHG